MTAGGAKENRNESASLSVVRDLACRLLLTADSAFR